MSQPVCDVAEEEVSDEGVGPEGLHGASGAVDGGAGHGPGLQDVSIVGHLDATPQRGVAVGETAPRVAYLPGSREEVGRVQLPEYGGERV